jgi:hypothetical protein
VLQQKTQAENHRNTTKPPPNHHYNRKPLTPSYQITTTQKTQPEKTQAQAKNQQKTQPKTTVEIGRLHHLQTVGSARQGGSCFAAWWWLASPWVQI